MSYILDALRRSDSERERGSVPSIHAHPVPPFSADAKAAHRGKPWVWIAIGLSAGLLVALGSIWIGGETPRQLAGASGMVTAPAPTPTPDQMPTRPPVAANTVPSPAAAPAPPSSTSPALPSPPAPATPPIATTAPARARTPPASPPEAATTAPRKSVSAAPTAAPATTTKPTAPVKAPASAPAAEGRIYAQGELPEDIRRQLPPLAIGGSIYSEQASNRMLIVNGQLLHEGDKLAPDLTLEQIKLKTAVLRFKGYRYEVSY